MSNGPTPETIEALENGAIDFGIVSTPFEGREEMRAVPVRQIENILLPEAGSGNSWKGGSWITES